MKVGFLSRGDDQTTEIVKKQLGRISEGSFCGMASTAKSQKQTSEQQKKVVRRPSKAQRAEILFAKLEKEIAEGKTVEQALEGLTPAQYDFLCGDEFASRLDSLTLTPEQREAAKQARQIGRESGKPRGPYNKKYSDEKQMIFSALCETVTSLGGEIVQKERENFRDLDFHLNGKHYRVVFSNPRT